MNKTLREKIEEISDLVASNNSTAAIVKLAQLNLTILDDATALVKEELTVSKLLKALQYVV